MNKARTRGVSDTSLTQPGSPKVLAAELRRMRRHHAKPCLISTLIEQITSYENGTGNRERLPAMMARTIKQLGFHDSERPMTGTYRDEFPPGTRVVICAAKSDGTDHDFNGRKGTVVEFYKCLAIELDKPPKYGNNPVLISPHCFRRIGHQ